MSPGAEFIRARKPDMAFLPTSASAFDAFLESESFTSPVRLFMMVRREVSACEDLMPAFAIRPMASAVSSAENPSALAIGAQYLKVSPITPIMDTGSVPKFV